MSLVGENLPARKLEQDAGNVIAAQIRDKIITAPSTEAKQDALILRVGEVTANPVANSLLGRLKAVADALALPLTVAAHAVTQSGAWVLSAGSAIIGKVGIDPALNAVVATPSTDQDPVFDETNGQKVTLVINTSTDIITPPAGCKFVRLSASADTFITTDDSTVLDNGKSILLVAGQPEIVPVRPTVKVKALSASAAVVRAMPLKVR